MEAFIDFASTILETRLADVVKHRRAAKRDASSSAAPASAIGGATSHEHRNKTTDDTLKNSIGSDPEDIFMEEIMEHDEEQFVPVKSSEDKEETQPPLCQQRGEGEVLLTSNCRHQLRAYIRRIASMYRTNRYHGLEHAVHVTMSANKLLEMLYEGNNVGVSDVDASGCDMNDFTTSEPNILSGYEDYVKGGLNDSTHSAGEVGDGGGGSSNEYCTKFARGALSDQHETVLHSGSSAASTAAFNRILGDSAMIQSSPNLDDEKIQHRHELRPMDGRFDLKRPSIDKNPPYSPSHHPQQQNHQHQHQRSSTYLIYSDMFTKFAFIFAAIIHDVDHQGVPNARLVAENDPVVEVHGGISTAEKHSIKVAFRTLHESEFDELQSVVFESPDDQLQMHRIVTNLVISTDIASPERMQGTKMRWEQAFLHHHHDGGCGNSPVPFGRLSLAGQASAPLSEIATVQASKPQLVPLQASSAMNHSRQQRRNSLKRVLQLNGGQTVEYFTECDDDDHDARMALRHSVVLETMLNVADVAHSMQSWELFCFWNRKLFEELYDAFKSGRSGNDPQDGWYTNQLGFYRLYVIPLAEKMKTCGVFGEKGEEWVRNAVSIRDRWEREGERVTKEMIEEVTSAL